VQALVDREFVEPGDSAQTIEKRPVFRELLRYVAEHAEIDDVTIYMRLRAFRNFGDAVLTKRQLAVGIYAEAMINSPSTGEYQRIRRRRNKSNTTTSPSEQQTSPPTSPTPRRSSKPSAARSQPAGYTGSIDLTTTGLAGDISNLSGGSPSLSLWNLRPRPRLATTGGAVIFSVT
jgi:hypothetical protein